MLLPPEHPTRPTFLAMRLIHHFVRALGSAEAAKEAMLREDPDIGTLYDICAHKINTDKLDELPADDASVTRLMEAGQRVMLLIANEDDATMAHASAQLDAKLNYSEGEEEPAPPIDLREFLDAIEDNLYAINDAQWVDRKGELLGMIKEAPAEFRREILQTIAQAEVEYNPGEFSINGVEVGYAEPGYTDPELPFVFTGNWNRSAADFKNIAPYVIEAAGGETEWSDEWITCEDCNKLVRTEPDSYGWTKSYAIVGNACRCKSCIKADPSDYVESLVSDPTVSDTFRLDFSEYGFALIDYDFARGLYEGQADNPRKVAKHLEDLGVERYIFQITDVGQFDARFRVWVDEAHAAIDLDSAKCRDEVSPAEHAKKALRSIPPLTPGTIQITTIDTDIGVATTRTISPEEFIAGVSKE